MMSRDEICASDLVKVVDEWSSLKKLPYIGYVNLLLCTYWGTTAQSKRNIKISTRPSWLYGLQVNCQSEVDGNKAFASNLDGRYPSFTSQSPPLLNLAIADTNS